MKTFFVNNFLSEFKSYRKSKGGIWYKIYDNSTASGMTGPIVYWTKTKPNDNLIIEEIENYN